MMGGAVPWGPASSPAPEATTTEPGAQEGSFSLSQRALFKGRSSLDSTHRCYSLRGQGEGFIHSPPPSPKAWETPASAGALPPSSAHPGLPQAQPGPQLSQASAVPSLRSGSLLAPAPVPRKVDPEGCLLCGLTDPGRPRPAPTVFPLPLLK